MPHAQIPSILLPLSSLKWKKCCSLPVGLYDAQAAFLDGTLHVGGGYTEGTLRDCAKLFSYKLHGDDSWTTTVTPTYYYSLTTFNSCLLLVGGTEYPSEEEETTNKIYTMINRDFEDSLPPMKEGRQSASVVSSGSALIVAGGYGFTPLSSVEVYKDGQWTSRQSLPGACYDMKSVLHKDKWFLVGGNGQGTKVYCVSLQSLISGAEADQSLWKILSDAPFECSSAAVFGDHFLSIGGIKNRKITPSIHAYSDLKRSWILVGELPTPMCCASVIFLPTGELMMIGGYQTSKSWSKQAFLAFIEG